MGSIINPNIKSGIKINDKDAFDYRPEDVVAIINSDKSGIVKAIFESKLMDDEHEGAIIVDENYASHAGRPPISKVPYMRSENDGYPYIPGHAPNCNGEVYAKKGPAKGMCQCKYDDWNHAGGVLEKCGQEWILTILICN